ncbi:DinB family protein [Chitinivorax sp. B]|uniref:DinB family protein n=1 Tax=Chitinivorax sp. B TaxID=2502235 RepID=UPI0010FA1143|nr:DinB family protein [Chitinivorax sp. B]
MDLITLAALGDFPHQLAAHYAAIPNDFKNWRPESWVGIPSEPFTPLEQICHIRDIEIDGYHVRILRTLREENPLLESLDGEILSKERDYSVANAAEVFATFQQARAKTIELVTQLSPDQLVRPAMFEGCAITLRGLLHLLCSHDQQHLAGLQWLKARIESPMSVDNIAKA